MYRVRLHQLGICVVALTLGATKGWPQISASQTADCSDPRYSGSIACQSPAGGSASSGRYPSSTEPQLQPTQQTDSAGRDVYVDSAGFPQNANRQTQDRRVFRQEPLTDLQKLARQSTGELLPIFGRELFRTPPSTFAPADQIPASPDYILGPGDEVLLRIAGHTNENLRLTVDRSGAIYVPHLGSVNVARLRFRELDQHLRQELGRTYRNFNLSVNLGKLRSIQVFVLGEAYAPGSYTVSSLSTAFNALLVSGGPTPQGSLRAVQIRRGADTIATLDLYDLILKGDRSKDLVLQSGDVLFIPFVGPQVAVSGSVKHPAVYEIRSSDTVGKALANAGGPSSTASDARLSIERIEDHHERHVMGVSLDPAGLATRLLGGDVLHVDPVLIGYKDSVTIRGNLANAGRFPWHPGMKLSDIIPDRESLLTNDYWRDRIRLGLPTPLFEPSQDRGNTLGRDSYRDTNGTLLNQEQRRQEFQRTPEDRTTRNQNPDDETGNDPQTSYNDSYSDRQAQDTSRNALASRDRLQNPDAEQDSRSPLADQQVSSARNLAPPGRTTEIKIGVPEIDWSYAVVQRLDPKTLRNSLVPFDLGKLVNDHDVSQDLALQPGDIVTILSQNDIHVRQDDQTKYVRLEGEFVNAGVYSMLPGQTLQDVVRKAGGLTDKAYLYGSSFTRESARILQQQRLNEYVSTLTMTIERESATRSLSNALGASANQSAMLDQLRHLRATGRIVLEFRPASAGLESIPNIPMEDGDTFRVPSRPFIVSVVGSVYGQNVFLYNSASKVRNYLLLAGKTTRVADRKHSFIIRADGSVYSHDARGGPWGENFDAATINPGDTIVVPEKPIKPSTLRDIIDYSQLFSSFALGAAAIQVIK